MPAKSTLPAQIALALIAGALAGCSARTHDKNGNETASISFGDGNGASADGSAADKTVAINVPGFSAKVAIPGLSLGGADTRIDGIALYPGTKMSGVNINADGSNDGSGGESQGHVDMAFFAPASPDRLLGYYKDAAKKDGWTEQPPAAGQQFAATKTDHDGKLAHLAMSMAAVAGGSNGHFQIEGE